MHPIMFRVIVLFLYTLNITSCDWVSEWMSPIQEQLKKNPTRRTNKGFSSVLDDDNLQMEQVVVGTANAAPSQLAEEYSLPGPVQVDLSSGSLKIKLENTLQSAKMLAETLKQQIKVLLATENVLKEAIVNGRYGVSSVVVTLADRAARSYIVRGGVWTLCKGVIHAPDSPPAPNSEHSLVALKCIGQEFVSQPDPCVFNSLIKYETVPVTRRLEYSEDDYLCLKQSFNHTLERYMSVPRQTIKDTCQNGVVRSMEENNAKCGLRVLSEYTYYPFRGYNTGLPLEYCSEPDGSCKLIMAWHVSNSTVENFEFLNNEPGFKKYFIKSEGFLEHIM